MESYRDVLHYKILDKNDIAETNRLDSYICSRNHDFTKSYVQNLIEKKLVLINGKEPTKNGQKLKVGDDIAVILPVVTTTELEPEDIPISILYEDEYLAIINKPAGLVVHPAVGHTSGTLVNALLHHMDDLSAINDVVRPGIVHRLDKDTSGAIVIAKTNDVHLALTEMFAAHKVHKIYLCVVKGILACKGSIVETNIGRDPKNRQRMAVLSDGGKPAITEYDVISESKNTSLLKVTLHTGRTHQIRVHMKHLGHPILGDSVYGKVDGRMKHIDRQMLHAYSISFEHPVTHKSVSCLAPLPDDMKECIDHFGLNREHL